MTVNFRFNNGGTDVDFDDVFIRRDIFAQGNLWLWGQDNSGQLGDNDRISKSSPVQTVSAGINWKQVAMSSHSAAIKTDGSLWLWGDNSNGSLGNNAQGDRSSPVQTVSGGTNWKQVSCGGHTAAIKTDGSLWLWGLGTSGQLGNNAQTNRSSPVQTVSGGTNWKMVSVGAAQTAAIKTDGTLWTWGSGEVYGSNGDNTTINRSSPVQTISGGTNWQYVSTGGFYVAAIKTDGTLWLWGYNNVGQLGTNDITNRSSPVQTISGGTNWKQVSAAGGSLGGQTAAIKTDGTLWTWGQNNFGQLGNNAQGNQSSPVQTVSGGTNWKIVSAGSRHIAAIKTDGTLWSWGDGANGGLGDNTTVSKSSPVQTISGGTNWKAVTGGSNTTGAITDLNVYQY